MQAKDKSNFKAVDYMRKVRDELSDLYHSDKVRYHKELKKTMTDFLAARKNLPLILVWHQASKQPFFSAKSSEGDVEEEGMRNRE
jgi:hypothetical protein